MALDEKISSLVCSLGSSTSQVWKSSLVYIQEKKGEAFSMSSKKGNETST